jgi:hypothetical protein
MRIARLRGAGMKIANIRGIAVSSRDEDSKYKGHSCKKIHYPRDGK